MKVRLNLSTSPLESNRRFALVTSVIGGLAFVFLLVLSQRAYSIWSSDKTYRAREDALECTGHGAGTPAPKLGDFF